MARARVPQALLTTILILACTIAIDAQKLGTLKRRVSTFINGGFSANVKLSLYTYYNKYNIAFETVLTTTNGTLLPPFQHTLVNASDDTPYVIFPPGVWDVKYEKQDGIVTGYSYTGTGAVFNSNGYTGTAAASVEPLAITRTLSRMARWPARFKVILQDSANNTLGSRALNFA
ncbi:unnamed protein product [Closterium sp. Yama58-4]|nr:unnamed protein product [Closterium sp. Yama58-4]